MKQAVTLFVSSMTFGIVVALIYWFYAQEPIGTIMLGVMFMGFLFLAGYVLVTEREADLESDDPEASPNARAGETIGTFVVSSRWPPLLALSLLLVAAGIVAGTAVTVFGAVCFLLVLWGLVLESR